MYKLRYQTPDGRYGHKEFETEELADAWIEKQWETEPGLKVVDAYTYDPSICEQQINERVDQMAAATFGMTVEQYRAMMAENKIKAQEWFAKCKAEQEKRWTVREYRA